MKAPFRPCGVSPWLASLWEIDVIDDAIADEQLLSPSLREQLAKERISEDNTSSSVDTAIEPMERVKARLTELSERLAGSATASKPGAR